MASYSIGRMVSLKRHKKCGKLIDLFELRQLGQECKFALAEKNEAPVKRSVRLTESGAGPWELLEHYIFLPLYAVGVCACCAMNSHLTTTLYENTTVIGLMRSESRKSKSCAVMTRRLTLSEGKL